MKFKNSWLTRAIVLFTSFAISIASLAVISPAANAAVTTTTFEIGDPTYKIAPFGGASASTVTNAPSGFVGQRALKIAKYGNFWAGVTILSSCGNEFLSAASKSISAKIYSADTGTVKMKIEDTANGATAVEKDITPSAANSWLDVTWDFTTPTSGTYSAGANYNQVTIFFNFVNPSSPSGELYYIDSIAYQLASTSEANCATVTTPSTIVTFDSGDTSGYSLSSWEWGKGIVNGAPGGAACPNNGLELSKPVGAGNYAGTKILELSGDQSIISSSSKVVTANVYSDRDSAVLGMTITSSDGTKYISKDIAVNKGWQKVTYDYATWSWSSNNNNDGFSNSVRYNALDLKINGGNPGAGEVFYVDDIAFNGTATPDIAVAPCPVVVPKSLGMITSPNISVGDGVVTCKVGTYTTPATDAVFYLFLNGQVISGKSTSAKANWMADWNFVPMSYKSASITSGASWPIQKDWSDGRTSKVQCLVKAYADRGLDVSRTSTATIDKVGRTVRQTAITDLTMRLVEPAMTKTNGVPSNYVDFSYDPIQNNWAKYYGPNLGVFYKYFEAGSTFKVTYKVTNSKTGKPVTNRPVWLIVNKNYGGVQMASFTYSWNEETSAIAGHSTDVGEVQIPGWTDAEGLVSFTLTNTNSATEAEPKPAKLYEIQPTSVTPLFSTITLTAHLGSDETHETKDIIWGHFTK